MKFGVADGNSAQVTVPPVVFVPPVGTPLDFPLVLEDEPLEHAARTSADIAKAPAMNPKDFVRRTGFPLAFSLAVPFGCAASSSQGRRG